jgi:hypothetical protein
MILLLKDTTEFSYASTNPDKIGWTTNLQVGRDMVGKPILHKKCGILMHSSLPVTDNGLPLGLCAIKFWTRKQFKGANELKRHITSTRISIEEKESYRWLENLNQSTELIQQLQGVFILVTRKVTFMSYLYLQKNVIHTFL